MMGPLGSPGDSLTHPESDSGDDPTPPCGHNPGCGCGAPWDREEPGESELFWHPTLGPGAE